ncbi:hypothetical protein [Microbacterium sp. RG1]|uniref:hypothetical protein n=1 Tax=Microbacterium sp. RG1 TaxID=2489212 RepID=UPI0010CA4BE7|nr:hypothetical protein [Microbacterium sp. RG1]QCQ15444.1 hypothetical protein EHF32_01125 [Microbacterium sp. RG1]
MTWRDAPPLTGLRRRRDEPFDRLDERRLRRELDAGIVVRAAPGVFVDGIRWRTLTPMARHAQRVWEASIRVAPGTVFSHHAAAALHGIDTLGEWPARLDVSVEADAGGRSTGLMRRHTRAMADAELLPWGDYFVTSPAQTAVDLAASGPFVQGVAAIDQAIWSGRPGGALTTPAQVRERVAARPRRGLARIHRALAFARVGAANVRESQSRVLIVELGFPEPEIQHRIRLADGALYIADFFWPRHDHIGEFDGLGKYFALARETGRTPVQALAAEKDREDALRRLVSGFSRWRAGDLDDPRRLYDILRGAGLPTSCPRPLG